MKAVEDSGAFGRRQQQWLSCDYNCFKDGRMPAHNA